MFELGLLLGQYQGAQSFESVGSWDMQTTQSSIGVQTTLTHSSGSAGRLEVYSGAVGALQYTYADSNDLFARWTTDVTTHKIVSYFWAGIDTAGNSGDVTAVMFGDSTPISFSNSLDRYRLETNITSETGLALQFDVASLDAGSYSLYVDDVLTAVDLVDLYPDRDFLDTEELQQARNTALDGRETSFIWAEVKRWNVPVRYVEDVEARQIISWWRNSYNLLFIENTSDTAAAHIVRITNTSAPLTQVSRPYTGNWYGNITLESVHNSLDF